MEISQIRNKNLMMQLGKRGISNLYLKVWCRPTLAYLDTLIHSLFYLEPKLPSELKRVIPIIKTNLRHTSAIALVPLIRLYGNLQTLILWPNTHNFNFLFQIPVLKGPGSESGTRSIACSNFARCVSFSLYLFFVAIYT
jgi:hypothetical protein